ncbi:hypothetical protein IFM89_018639 [Coptis chinensis]|uniref:Cation/H+ exchanger domain-containing protein n=1 Tax=Coptis chinensis TaxID=261450 RepID=A0A835LWI1_9MAGN|nr:hypothetical protein IFM89_018639 [Coptis chinensis]
MVGVAESISAFPSIASYLSELNIFNTEFSQLALSSSLISAVVLLAYFSILLDLDIMFGPFIFGLMIPPGPPLGSALVNRLELFNKWIIMLIFYTTNGMAMNVYLIDLSTALIVGMVALASCTGKFLGAFLPALYYNMSFKDAILLGLTMNAQGFTDVSFFQVLTVVQLVNYDYFQIMVLSTVVITGAFAPLVGYLHKSSMKYNLLNRRTIAHSELNTPL